MRENSEDLVDVVLGLAIDAIHEQTAETTRLKASIDLIREEHAAWLAVPQDAALHRVLEHFATLTPQASRDLGRALGLLQQALTLALAARSKHEAWQQLEALSSALKKNDLRPLPRRRFPPYPQVQLILDATSGPAPHDQLRASSRLVAALEGLRQGDSPALLKSASAALRRELVTMWQSADQGDAHDAVEVVYREFLADLIPAVNDAFAREAGIDPRFANFVPFVWLAQTRPLATRADAEAFRLSVHARHRLCLELYRERVAELSRRLSQHAQHTDFGDKFPPLLQRLSLENPAYAPEAEQRFAGQMIRQALAFIDRKLENAALALNGTPRGGEPSYTVHALLLLDLKKLHQAVGAMYGGVAFSDDIRRLLMMVGAMGFRLLPTQPEFSAATFTSALSELGLRAGLLTQPLESLGDAECQTALEQLRASRSVLAGWADAGVLTAATKGALTGLRAIARSMKQHDDGVVEAILLADVVGVLDVAATLELLALTEVVEGLRLGGLSEYLSIIPSLTKESAGKGEAALMADLCTDPVIKAWADSRGGLLELQLAHTDDPLASPLSAAWKNYVRRTLAVDAARQHGVVLCLTCDDADPSGRHFPSVGLQQLLRLRAGNVLSNAVQARWSATQPLVNHLCEVTQQVYLNDESAAGEEVMRPLRSLMRFLALRGEALASEVYADILAASGGKVQPQAVAAITRRWLGPGLALSRFLAAEDGFEGAPDDVRARRSLVELGILRWGLLREQLSAMVRWMKHNPLSVIRFHLWKTLPRGHFSQTLALVEAAYRATERALSFSGLAEAANDGHSWEGMLRDAEWLLELSQMDAQST